MSELIDQLQKMHDKAKWHQGYAANIRMAIHYLNGGKHMATIVAKDKVITALTRYKESHGEAFDTLEEVIDELTR